MKTIAERLKEKQRESKRFSEHNYGLMVGDGFPEMAREITGDKDLATDLFATYMMSVLKKPDVLNGDSRQKGPDRFRTWCADYERSDFPGCTGEWRLDASSSARRTPRRSPVPTQRKAWLLFMVGVIAGAANIYMALFMAGHHRGVWISIFAMISELGFDRLPRKDSRDHFVSAAKSGNGDRVTCFRSSRST